MLQTITRIEQNVKIVSVLLSHELLSTKIYFFISRQIQSSKNYQNPRSTSKDTCKTILFILYKLFSIHDSFEFNVTQET